MMQIMSEPGTTPLFESNGNYLEFSTKQIKIDHYNQPIYGVVIPITKDSNQY